jgi:hypothetical protein
MEFTEKEQQERMEAALRGAREVGHKQMKDMDRKRKETSIKKPARSK